MTTGALSRRQLLSVGGIGMLGLTLPELLRAKESQSIQAPAASATSCIFLCLYGGASQIDTWDMKPDAPAEYRGPYKPIATATPGIRITELMPRLARLSENYCLIRSMTHTQADHTKANTILLSGKSNPAADARVWLRPGQTPTRDGEQRSRLCVAARSSAGERCRHDSAFLSGGFRGAAYSPVVIGTKDHTRDPSAPGFRVTAFDTAAGVSKAPAARPPTAAHPS